MASDKKEVQALLEGGMTIAEAVLPLTAPKQLEQLAFFESRHAIPIYVAVEDELSEWVVRRLLTLRTIPYAVGAVFGRSGAGYLKKRAAAFNNAAKHCPFFLLAVFDQSPCVPALLDEWLDNPRHKHFLLRIAVHEVESWLLGDLIGLVEFLGCRPPIRAFVP